MCLGRVVKLSSMDRTPIGQVVDRRPAVGNMEISVWQHESCKLCLGSAEVERTACGAARVDGLCDWVGTASRLQHKLAAMSAVR